jgi:hypothetical protein
VSDAERVIFGFHTVLARLRADPRSVLEVFLDEARKDARAKSFAAAVESAGVRLMRVTQSRLEGMAGGGRHQGVVARVVVNAQKQTLEELLERLESEKIPPLLLVLDGITDPHNLGACLRVADGAGVHAVIAPKDHAVGINATVAKVASGAAETLATEASPGKEVISNPENGWVQLRGRLAVELATNDAVLPAQMRMAFVSLRALSPLTVGRFESIGGLEGLEAAYVRERIAQAAAASNLTDDQIRAIEEQESALASGTGNVLTGGKFELDRRIADLRALQRNSKSTSGIPAWISFALGSAYFRSDAIVDAERPT